MRRLQILVLALAGCSLVRAPGEVSFCDAYPDVCEQRISPCVAHPDACTEAFRLWEEEVEEVRQHCRAYVELLSYEEHPRAEMEAACGYDAGEMPNLCGCYRSSGLEVHLRDDLARPEDTATHEVLHALAFCHLGYSDPKHRLLSYPSCGKTP